MATVTITPEIEEDARRLAEATGTTPTEAVAEALREKLHLVVPAHRAEAIKTWVRKMQALPVINHASEDDILGFDESGTPEQSCLGR